MPQSGRRKVRIFDDVTLKVGLVSRDKRLRFELARAFDDAPGSWDIRLLDQPSDGFDVLVAGPDAGEPNGAVPFDPANPEAVLEEVERRASIAPRAIVVTSPVGGAGTTTVALHLARECAARASSCYVDLSKGGGAAPRLGLPPGHTTWGAGEIHDAGLPVSGGFRALFAPPDADDVLAEETLIGCARSFEHVVADTTHPPFLRVALCHARTAVMVLPPSTVAAELARATMENWAEVTWAAVVNSSGPRPDVSGSDLSRALGRAPTMHLPCTPALREREEQRDLLPPGTTRWSRRVARLARALVA